MEAVAVLQAVNNHNNKMIQNGQSVTRVLIAKGVTDHADADKDDSYQSYCAHVSAAWAYVLLHKYGKLMLEKAESQCLK